MRTDRRPSTWHCLPGRCGLVWRMSVLVWAESQVTALCRPQRTLVLLTGWAMGWWMLGLVQVWMRWSYSWAGDQRERLVRSSYSTSTHCVTVPIHTNTHTLSQTAVHSVVYITNILYWRQSDLTREKSWILGRHWILGVMIIMIK